MAGSSMGPARRRCGMPARVSAAATGCSWALVRASTAMARQRPPGGRTSLTMRGDAGRLGLRVGEGDGPGRGPSGRLATGPPSPLPVSTAWPRPTIWGVERWLRRRCTTVAPGWWAVKSLEPAAVGAVPPVDGLVGVADHAQVGPAAAPGLEQGLLERVDVLELVDEQVAEPPATAAAKAPSRAISATTRDSRSSKSTTRRSRFSPRSARRARPPRPGRARAPPGRRRGAGVGRRADLPGPRPLDLGRDVCAAPRRAPGGGRPAPPRRAGAGTGERRGPPPLVLPALPQEPVGHGVERAGGDGVPRPRARRSRPASSPAASPGEREGQHVAGSADPSRMRRAMRRVSTRVLPEPAGARMQSGAPSDRTAVRCSGRGRPGADRAPPAHGR